MRVPLWQWAIPGMVYVGAMLPAWAMGWPATDLATVYLRQAGHFSFPGNLANPWLWIWSEHLLPGDGKPFYFVGYGAALAAAAGIAVLAARSVGRKQTMVALALLSALAIPWLLPKMHERYFFLADVLAFALALGIRNPATRGIAIAVQCVSLAALFSYVTNWSVPGMAGAVVAVFVMFEIHRQARLAPPKPFACAQA
jgi:Gpi18-like mannosyltransferase